MSAATNTPQPDPNDTEKEAGQRPDLHVVRSSTDVVVPAETSTEITGPVPVLDADGTPVAGTAPLDVRIRDAALRGLGEIPAFGTVPASFRESLEYSQQGDWATSERSAKRLVHGLATVFAFVATYPLVEGLGKAREKPIALVLTVLVLAAIGGTLTALF